MSALRQQGVDVGLWRPAEPPPDVLILSKRYDGASLGHAKALRDKHGTKLVLDLCDNHFYNGVGEPNWTDRARALRTASSEVDRIVASSAALAETIADEVPTHPPLHVIGDAADEPDLTPPIAKKLQNAPAELALWRLGRSFLAANVCRARRAVWFGNHGSPNAEGGMSDLLLAKAALQTEAVSAPLSLTVISNSRSKFQQLLADWPIPAFYLPWNATTFSRALRMHAVCLIPIRHNPFTACKTSNRVTTALLHGLSVVADPIPSYLEFGAFIHLGDWTRSLHLAMRPSAAVHDMVERGAGQVRRLYSIDKIAQSWHAVAADALRVERRPLPYNTDRVAY